MSKRGGLEKAVSLDGLCPMCRTSGAMCGAHGHFDVVWVC